MGGLWALTRLSSDHFQGQPAGSGGGQAYFEEIREKVKMNQHRVCKA
jgi:hypothetical protein